NGRVHPVPGIGDDDLHHTLLAMGDDGQVTELRTFHCRFRIDEQVEQDLLQLLFVAADLRIRLVEMHMHLDTARARSERTQTNGMLDDGIDVDDDVTRLRLAREQKKVANDANCAVCLAFDEAHRLELLALQLVLEQKLGEGGNASKRIVQLVRYSGDQLANSRELLGSP